MSDVGYGVRHLFTTDRVPKQYEGYDLEQAKLKTAE